MFLSIFYLSFVYQQPNLRHQCHPNLRHQRQPNAITLNKRFKCELFELIPAATARHRPTR